jgi:hypothetical protein
MALNPSISLGVRPLELTNPLAQYGQIAAIQNAQNQNQLAQFQLGAAQRADLAATAQNELYARHFDPTKGAVDVNAFVAEAAQRGQGGIIPGFLKTEAERKAAATTLKKTEGEIAKNEFDLQQKKYNRAWQSAGAAATPQIAIDQITKAVRNGEIDMATATREIQTLQKMPPEEYRNWRANKILELMDAKDQLSYILPKVSRQDTGGVITTFQDNPMMPGYGLPVAGASIAKTPTFGDIASQGQLNLARQKFAWEQANPGFELKETESGDIVGVNKRTLQAFPVMLGGAAPAAAPMAGAGMPGARMPAATTVPAIPGMTSVLDQQAPAAAPAAGMPLRGKGTALTETQSNATAFGMRMKEANSILTSLEKAGVKNTGLISGVAGSIVGIVPLIGDKLTGITESVFNVLPQIMGGLSPEQQQVAQARLNFITANLRKESGATLLPSEFITEEKKYFPKPGDDATVIAQKQKARNLALQAMEIQAGPGAKNIQQYQTGVAGGGGGGGGIPNATPTNPLGLAIPGVR